MKISPVKIYNNATQKAYANSLKKTASDTFISSNLNFGNLKRINPVLEFLSEANSRKILKRFDKFSVDEFNSLTKNEYKALKSASFGRFLKETQIIEDCAKVFKECYDKWEGEGNYIFVSIGRSLEHLASALKLKGIETKMLPISNVVQDISAKDVISQAGFEEYISFIKKSGLDAQTIKNSPKKFIFSDYSYTGHTMDVVKEILLSEKIGIKPDDVKFLNFGFFYEGMHEKVAKIPRTTPPEKR